MSSQIKPFYSNANVLVTGGTGFLGKILIQKLLRACDDIGGIYLIIRRKNEKSIAERLEDMCKDVVFNKLKEEQPNFLRKLHLLEGDCGVAELGLNKNDRQLLINKIDIVFHCAASMSMDAKLKDAVNTNIRGVGELMDLCQEMKHLKSMVYVSTAYSNCTQYLVEERFYDTPIQAKTLINLTEEVKEKVLDDITTGLIDKWPNTYCFTKAVAEDELRKKAGNMPVGLFRPSIVMPTYTDPVPGWSSNVYGPVGVMLATGLGILRVFPGKGHKKCDVVPVDLCVNALICTAWEVHQKKSEPKIPVYNYTGGPRRNMTWTQMMDYCQDYEYPFKDALWVTLFFLVSNVWCYNSLWFLLHTIPAYLIDAYLFVTGKKTRLVKTYKKIGKFCNVLSFFTSNDWNLVNQNVYNLLNQLEDADKKLFPFDMDLLNYRTYILNVCTGLKLYTLKESLDNAEAEKRRYQRMLKIHKTVKYISMLIATAILYKFVCLFI